MSGHGMSVSFNLDPMLRAGQQAAAEKGGTKGKSFYAGNIMTGGGQPGTDLLIEQKRNFARKQAMKLIGDAWDRDTKTADSINEVWKEKAAKVSEMNGLHGKVKEADEEKAALQEQYGVAADSQEQKDLELLEKYQNNITGASCDSFTQEELDRLRELSKTSRTEYQKQALALNATKNRSQMEAEKLQNEVIGMNGTLRDMQSSQLQSQDMLDAADSGEQILDAAEKEIFGMLIQDAKGNIDEKLEEEVEEAKEKAEAKEEQDEKIEEAKEEREEQQEILEGADEADKIDQELQNSGLTESSVEEAQKNIQRILQENNLINEDLKGIEIDLGF